MEKPSTGYTKEKQLKKSGKKESPKAEATVTEATKPHAVEQVKVESPAPTSSEPLTQPVAETPTVNVKKTEPPKPLTLAGLKQELEILKSTVIPILAKHDELLVSISESLARKRTPVQSNGKVQIKDKTSGKIYKSKNATYKTLLKEGALKDLADQGIFGSDPEHNTFGWYALNRAYPGRFEEIHETKAEEAQQQAKS